MYSSKSKKTALAYDIENEEYSYLNYFHFYFSNYIPELVLSINKQKISKKVTHLNKKITHFFYCCLIKCFRLPPKFDLDFSSYIYEAYDTLIYFHIRVSEFINRISYKIETSDVENRNEIRNFFSYIIDIIYDDKSDNFKILAVFLIAVPNGKLKKIYKDEIIGAGKSKGKSFRYEYKRSPYFKLFNKNEHRIKPLFLDKNYKENDFTGL